MSNSHQRAHDEVITHLITSGFLSPRPRVMGVRAWSMLLPSVAQVIGGLCFGTVAWSLTEVALLPPAYRVNLVVVGAFAIAIGGNAGSLPVAVEVFRKKDRTWIDWATLVFSSIASWVEMVIAMSFLGGFDIAQNAPRIYAMTLLAILDTTFGISQFAAYLAGHNERMVQWQEDFKVAVAQDYGRPAVAPEPVYEIATGADAYSPPLPTPAVSENGNGGYCWCGQFCKNANAYSAHQRAHQREVAPYASSVVAREEMRERYADTIDDARDGWEFPSLTTVNRWREKTGG